MGAEVSCFARISRQFQPEPAAFTGHGFHANRASHPFHSFAYDGQTYAGSFVFILPVQAFKDVKNPLLIHGTRHRGHPPPCPTKP